MGLTGRPPKPDWLKAIDGNPGKRKLGGNADVLPVAVPLSPKPPEHFSGLHLEIWENVTHVLLQVKALELGDQFPLARYVEMLALYRKAADWMNKQADGNIVYPIKDKNGTVKSIRMLPQLKAMLELSNHLLRIETHFGLTPSARASFGAKGVNPGDDDPFKNL